MGCFLAGCLRKNYEKTQRKGIISVVRSARGACGSGGFFFQSIRSAASRSCEVRD